MDIVVNGIRLQYIELGSGYPIICIHGNGLNRDLWRHLIPELCRQYRAIAYELRGAGKSEAPTKPGVTITSENHVNDLTAFMDALEIKKAAVVAQGLGSFVALQLAVEHPGRVEAMIVVNTAPRVPTTLIEQIQKWVKTAEKEGMEPLVDTAMKRWFLESFRRAHPDVIQRYQAMYAANPPMGYAANCRGIIQFDLTSELYRVKCPTLIVCGEQDKATTPQDHKAIAEKITNSKLVIIPGASHTVPEEQATELNRITLEFLDQNIISVN
jgi:3-oxoadipate enol-lactonase